MNYKTTSTQVSLHYFLFSHLKSALSIVQTYHTDEWVFNISWQNQSSVCDVLSNLFHWLWSRCCALLWFSSPTDSFEVKVNDQLIYSKLETGVFPDAEQVSEMTFDCSSGHRFGPTACFTAGQRQKACVLTFLLLALAPQPCVYLQII